MLLETLNDLCKEAYEAGDYDTAIVLNTLCGAIAGGIEAELSALCVEFGRKALDEEA